MTQMSNPKSTSESRFEPSAVKPASEPKVKMSEPKHRSGSDPQLAGVELASAFAKEFEKTREWYEKQKEEDETKITHQRIINSWLLTLAIFAIVWWNWQPKPWASPSPAPAPVLGHTVVSTATETATVHHHHTAATVAAATAYEQYSAAPTPTTITATETAVIRQAAVTECTYTTTMWYWCAPTATMG